MNCNDYALIGTIKAIKNLFLIVQISVPILLIISLVYTFIMMVKNPDNKKLIPRIKNSMLASGIIFFIPLLINVLMLVLGENYDFSNCWNNIKSNSNSKSQYIDIYGDKKTKIINDDDFENGKPKSTSSTNNSSNNTSNSNNNSGTSSFNLSGTHQAKEFHELGERAYQGDKTAQEEWVNTVGKIVNNAQHSKYGIKNSMIVAQIILESGWMHPPKRFNADGSSLVGSANNVLSVNYSMGRKISSQSSSWSKNPKSIDCSVSIYDSNGNIAYEVQKMRAYSSIEECIEDYADLVYIYHPECKNSNDMACYKSFITGYTNAAAYTKICSVIKNYNLERFD